MANGRRIPPSRLWSATLPTSATEWAQTTSRSGPTLTGQRFLTSFTTRQDYLALWRHFVVPDSTTPPFASWAMRTGSECSARPGNEDGGRRARPLAEVLRRDERGLTIGRARSGPALLDRRRAGSGTSARPGSGDSSRRGRAGRSP